VKRKNVGSLGVRSGLDRLADVGARFGSMRLDVRGMVRRAKTL
jgi:hypothetical protein